MRAEPVTGPVAFHGEGPVWWGRWGGLRWVDMFRGDVLSLEPDGTVARRHVGDIAAALRPRAGGGAVIGLERGFALESADGDLEVLGPVWDEPGIRFNDGGCDPDGGFWCGSMAYDQREGAGALYRLDAGRSVVRVLEGVTISNGIDWSPDGRLAYYNDTPTGRVDVFDYEAGALRHRRPFAAVEGGWPDGLTVDAEGGVWVALYAGGAVHRYDPNGRLDAVVSVPTPKPTACAFGGEDLGSLFITTTQEDLPPGSDPLAGALFVCEPGVRGRAVRVFGG